MIRLSCWAYKLKTYAPGWDMRVRMLRGAGKQNSSVLGNQKISKDNQKLRPGCPPDYQIFCERIDPKMFIPTNLSSYLSLTNKNSSMRTSTTYM